MGVESATSSFQTISIVSESEWGVTPATNLTRLRYTGESFTENASVKESEEFQASRGISDIFITKSEVSGELNIELLFGVYDDLLEGCLCSTWSDGLAISGDDIFCEALDNSINSETTDLSGISVDQWVKIEGFFTNPSAVFGRAVSVTTNKVVLAGVILVDEASTSVNISGSFIRSGNKNKSFSIEKTFTDTNKIMAYRGMTVSSFGLDIGLDNIVNGTFGFVGKSESVEESTIGTGDEVAAATTVPMVVGKNISSIFFNDSNTENTVMTEFSFNMDLSVESMFGLLSIQPVDAHSNNEQVTGKFGFYFVNFDQYNMYKNQTSFHFSVRFTDKDGNNLILSLPNVKIKSAEIVAGSEKSDIIAKFEYQALSSGGYSVQIDKFAA